MQIKTTINYHIVSVRMSSIKTGDRQTTQLPQLKILQKESTAEYLKQKNGSNQVKKKKRTQDSLRDLWDNIKVTSIRIIGVPGAEEKKKGYGKFFSSNLFKNFLKNKKRKGMRKFLKREEQKIFLPWKRKYSIKSKRH